MRSFINNPYSHRHDSPPVETALFAAHQIKQTTGVMIPIFAYSGYWGLLWFNNMWLFTRILGENLQIAYNL
jgi:hypothetical protein